MPKIVNNFNLTLGQKGYLEYIFHGDFIVVCGFSPLDQIHALNRALKVTDITELNKALSEAKFGYAKLIVSTPDKLKIRLPLTSLREDARLRDTVVWFARRMHMSLGASIEVEFIKKDVVYKKEYASDHEFLKLAIYAVM